MGADIAYLPIMTTILQKNSHYTYCIDLADKTPEQGTP
jgi:hypothetical protein